MRVCRLGRQGGRRPPGWYFCGGRRGAYSPTVTRPPHCSTIRSDLDDAGLNDMSIAFTVTNDLDSDYVLLTVQDGSVVFDVLDGFPGVDF